MSTENAAKLIAEQERLPTDPRRIKAFATFYKGYMSVSAIVTAALPIPATALIPHYSALTGLLATYTTLFCFLIIAFIFFSRHALARSMFGDLVKPSPAMRRSSVALWPAIFIVAALICAIAYPWILSDSVTKIQHEINPPPLGGYGQYMWIRIRILSWGQKPPCALPAARPKALQFRFIHLMTY
jgi:hypothetical protein